MRVKQMGVRVVRIKLQGSFVLIFGGVPIPVVPKDDETEFGMSVSESVVNFDGFLRRRFRFRQKLGWRHPASECKRAICVGESDVSERVRGVKVNRLLEI